MKMKNQLSISKPVVNNLGPLPADIGDIRQRQPLLPASVEGEKENNEGGQENGRQPLLPPGIIETTKGDEK
jgi:hypothetical protein